MKNKLTRRDFLKTSGIAASTAWAAPRFAIGKPGESANEKINVAVIGAGGMGSMAVGGSAIQNPVAFCDVDERRAAEFYAKHPQVPTFKDFRKMLDKHHKDIDAVLISTPDHTHFAATMASLERGKHVFVQKPLTNGMFMVGTKHTLYHDDMRVGYPFLLMSLDEWRSFRKTSLPEPTIPRVKVPFGPIGELYRAIKGGPTPGSNFDYAVPLTELCCLGCIALRTGKKVDYDPATMCFSDASLDRYVKGPVRPGWECGEQFWS